MSEYRIEEREDGFLSNLLLSNLLLFNLSLFNRNNDELERWEVWLPHGDCEEKKRQAYNVCGLMNAQDIEIVVLRARAQAAEADCAALREAAARVLWSTPGIGEGMDRHKRLEDMLKESHPGKALLDRLAFLEEMERNYKVLVAKIAS